MENLKFEYEGQLITFSGFDRKNEFKINIKDEFNNKITQYLCVEQGIALKDYLIKQLNNLPNKPKTISNNEQKEKKIKEVFLKHCDLTYDVGDKKIEEINVISYECFKEAVNELLNEQQTPTKLNNNPETKQLIIGDVSKRSELLSKFYSHLCDIAVINSEYRTEYDKKMIPSKFTL